MLGLKLYHISKRGPRGQKWVNMLQCAKIWMIRGVSQPDKRKEKEPLISAISIISVFEPAQPHITSYLKICFVIPNPIDVVYTLFDSTNNSSKTVFAQLNIFLNYGKTTIIASMIKINSTLNMLHFIKDYNRYVHISIASASRIWLRPSRWN